MDGSAGQIVKELLVLFYQPGKRIKILMISVNEIKRPNEALSFFNEKIIQVGSVYPEVPQMNDAGDSKAKRVFSVFDLLINRIKIAMGITDNQYH
jgi:hypothetical protein